ncbi:hypothetical protein ACJX0J_025436 [Zea mays]
MNWGMFFFIKYLFYKGLETFEKLILAVNYRELLKNVMDWQQEMRDAYREQPLELDTGRRFCLILRLVSSKTIEVFITLSTSFLLSATFGKEYAVNGYFNLLIGEVVMGITISKKYLIKNKIYMYMENV